MTTPRRSIAWFRQDLRIADNPALTEACKSGVAFAVYVLDDVNSEDWSMGGASRWWLHHSLAALDEQLGGNLSVFTGDARRIIPALAEETGADAVYWNRCYEPWRIRRDSDLKRELQEQDMTVRTFNGSSLFEAPTVKKGDGTPYKVFTPFYKNGCLRDVAPPRRPLPAPAIDAIEKISSSMQLDDLDLLPSINWADTMAATWQPGELGGNERLAEFLGDGLADYSDNRNRPDVAGVSRLSPYLHFGELSPNQVWYAAHDTNMPEAVAEPFTRQLCWREFSTNLLYNNPQLPTENLQSKFDRFPWRDDPAALRAWQRGQTGIPIVDAGMRELWQTGYMHNRVRMIVGSFLIKNLMLHWELGERWFWDTLLDADLANNSASWQWVAGTGADAAPYFRVFNPVLQGTKFDPDGDYVRRYVPEIAGLPKKYLNSPWEAPAEVLKDAGVALGENYPKPIVDLKETRDRALAAFKSLKPPGD